MVRKVIVVGHDNYGERKIFTRIVDAHSDIEFSLIITTGLYYKKSYLESMYSRANERGVPVYFTGDINGVPAHDFIKKFAPDIIVSTFTMHVFKQSTINLSRVATIGCHPAILQHRLYFSNGGCRQEPREMGTPNTYY